MSSKRTLRSTTTNEPRSSKGTRGKPPVRKPVTPKSEGQKVKRTTNRGPKRKVDTTLVQLRIANRNIRPLPPHDAQLPQLVSTEPPDLNDTGHLYVIRADLADLNSYADGRVASLMKVAKLLFEPLGNGTLHTFIREDVDYWQERGMNETDWRVVEEGEPLASTIYEFRGERPVSLSRISLPEKRSRTAATQLNLSNNFRTRLLARDGGCAISGISAEEDAGVLVASHFIPKRIEVPNTAAIVSRYDGPLFASDVTTTFHPHLVYCCSALWTEK
jgi:hypothetical protein